MKIVEVHPKSPLAGVVKPGDCLLEINGEPVRDSLDFQFKLAEENVDLTFTNGREGTKSLHFEYPSAESLGLTFEPDKTRQCGNKCIFCFVDQQPAGMRDSLYVKDEDYRLSFTHGNFITLSNTSETDLERIIEQRLSPIYVSVHTTDDELRKRMFRRRKLPSILPRLRRLAENGIAVHAQVVVCPGINNGEHLAQTIEDLSALYPQVNTLAVVPVGLTRYRDKLTDLRLHTTGEAAEVIDMIEEYQRGFFNRLGSRFVWAADEYYVTAGREFPKRSTYEEMWQFENGVGMAREFVTNFNRRRRGLERLNWKRRALFLTGASAWPFMSKSVMPHLTDKLGFGIDLAKVPNRFWGEMVTVTGLLTGQDLLAEAQKRVDSFDIVVLPPNCLNSDQLFLDNLSLDGFRKLLGKEVVVGSYDLASTVRELCQ